MTISKHYRLSIGLLFVVVVADLVFLYSFMKSQTVMPSHHLQKKWKSETTIINQSRSTGPFVDPVLSVDPSYLSMKTREILWFNAPPWLEKRVRNSEFRACLFRNCVLHENRSLLQHSAAVVFSLDHYSLGEKPPVRHSDRNPDQPWVFYSLEAPPALSLGQKAYKSPAWHGVFNWSWTYRVDADIFNPYGVLQKRQHVLSKNYSSIFKRKTKFAAWLVSHCITYSGRERFVRQLQRYIQVDIFGRCGKMENLDYPEMLNNEYKFYLSFENAFCLDYVSEKYFKYSKLDIVTVVRGGANYDRYLPNNTFINTNNFSSVKELAEYLLRIGSNEKDYISFLRRKDEYVFQTAEYSFQNGLCKLCEKLNTKAKRKTYPDIVQWLGNCSEPSDIIAG